ncbi:MAG: alpha/beta fold hydrolase [Clostridiales bacterium]|nr:alpha/beta fold hydrolase [Clostridiales bacterium]
MKTKGHHILAFVVSLAVLVFCSLINWGIVSDWGNVRIERIKLTGDNGQEYSALMYIPDDATNETPAPAIVMYHGGNGNARNHESWAVEFSRRGYVVLSVDWNGAGNSETSTYYTTESSSNIDACSYFYEYLTICPFVDSDQIIASGHSAGSEMALLVGIKYNSAAILACSGIRPLSSYGYEKGICRLPSVPSNRMIRRKTGWRYLRRTRGCPELIFRRESMSNMIGFMAVLKIKMLTGI